MRTTNAALAVLIALSFILPVLPMSGNMASAATAPAGGRSDPPATGTQWDIVENTNISANVVFAGNITVFSGVNLKIWKGGSITVPHNASWRWVLFVKAGGSVDVIDRSTLDVDHYIAESGTGLTVLNQSAVRARGVFNATSTVTVTDSSITVTAPSGNLSSEPGEPAKLILSSGSILARSVLTVTAGDGQKGAVGQGTDGGAGGDLTVILGCKEYSDLQITASAGKGGKGGDAGSTTANAGRGGRGGNVFFKVTGNSMTSCSFKVGSGIGGDGNNGAPTTTIDAGNAGEGGEGGAVDFRWAGTSLAMASTNVTVSSGHGGEGGDGGSASSNNKAGGNGARGGRGGTIVSNITCAGPMTMTDSSLNFWAGYGPTGGIYGRAGAGGKDGAAGDGGEGGSSLCTLSLNDSFIATNASVFMSAGDGGGGGVGSAGGKGGNGGTALLNLSLLPLLTEDTVTLKGSRLVSRGGAGGSGGKGLSVDQSAGIPGDGGKGGGAKLYIFAEKSVDISGSEISCDEGLNGTADRPGVPGNPGVGELDIYSRIITFKKSTYSQTMGPVDNTDLWRLESTPIVRINPPLRPPHFLPAVEAGVAEEHWLLTCIVQDIYGTVITDGSITVEVSKNESVVASKKTNAFGKAEFPLQGGRYTPSEITTGIVYSAKATDDLGKFSYSVGAQMVQDQTVLLTIIDKPYAPRCCITAPDESIQKIIDASQYIRQDGRIDTYLIEGTAQDHNQNPMQIISRVEVKIGDDGAWTPANFEMPNPNSYKWNLTWDIYNWSVAKLSTYPLGVIPCPIYARSYNDRWWSDDPAAFDNRVTKANMTVRLLKIPPPPPSIQITKPKTSPVGGNISFIEVSAEKLLSFDGTVLNSSGTRIVRWEWCFDDTNGFRPDFSSPVSPATNVTYPKDKQNLYFFVVLKIFDSESQRRVDLQREGVSYDDFGYAFEAGDGSYMVKLRVLVKEPPPGRDNEFARFLARYGGFLGLGITALIMMGGAIYTFQVRRRHIAERRAKEERETLRIDVSEMKCARCSEPIADPSKGCLQCKAQDALGQVQQRLLDIKGSGVNIGAAEALLETGVDAFDAKSFEEAYDKAQEAKKMAAEMEAKYQETATVINGWETRISALKVDRPESDASEAETKVYHSRLALGRGDHAEALKNLGGLEAVLARADKAGLKRGAEELVESTRRMVTNIQKRGVLLDRKVQSALEDAAAALEKGNYDLVPLRCKEAETLVKETNKSFMRASENLRQSEAKILNAKGMGQNVGTTEDLLAQAKTAMAQGNYAAVIEHTNRALAFFGIAPKVTVAAEKKVDWKREVAVLEGHEGKTEPSKPRITPAPAPKPAMLEVEPSPEMKEAAEKAIKETIDAIAVARELAVDISDGEDMLEKAKDAYKARRYDESADLAKSAKFLMAELAKTAPRPRPGAAPAARPAAAPAVPAKPAAVSGAAAELKATIDKAESLLNELVNAGSDITGPESKLTRAKAARDGGSPGVAMQYANESITESEEHIKEYRDAKNSMDDAEKRLGEAKKKGLDVSDAEFQLKQARSAMAGGAFGRVADTAKMILQMLKELEPAAAPAAKPAAPAIEDAAKAGAFKCPGCGRDAKPHWKTCPFCGATISTGAPAPAPAAAVKPAVVALAPAAAVKPAVVALAPAPAGKCPKCGAALKPHWKVCPSCGSDVVPTSPSPAAPAPAAPAPAKPPTCPACGSKVEPSWTSCPICNTALVPDKGVRPEAPKKVLKVAKKPVVVTKEVEKK